MAWDENSYPGYERRVHQFPGASTFVEYVSISTMKVRSSQTKGGDNNLPRRIFLQSLLGSLLLAMGIGRS